MVVWGIVPIWGVVMVWVTTTEDTTIWGDTTVVWRWVIVGISSRQDVCMMTTMMAMMVLASMLA